MTISGESPVTLLSPEVEVLDPQDDVQLPVTQLRMAVDNGASLTKGVVEVVNANGDRRLTFAQCFPTCKPITSSYMPTALRLVDDNTSLVSFGDEHWLVGAGASSQSEGASVAMPKAKTAIAKTLAFIGKEARLHPDQELHLSLGMLLPLDEIADSRSIEQQLSQHCWNFKLNGSPVKLVLHDQIQVSPEGYGVAINMTSSPAGVIVFGHRDVSFLYVEGGSILPGKSKTLSGFGMIKVLGYVPQTFKDEYAAARKIFTYIMTRKSQHLMGLCPNAEELAEQLDQSLSQAVLEIQHELSPLVGLVDKVMLTGGNSVIFERFFKTWLGSRLIRSKHIQGEMSEHLPELKRSPLLHRGADVFCLWKSMGGTDAQ